MHLINCPVCGKRMPINSPQCPECGFDLTEYTQEQSDTKPRKSKRIIAIIALIMIALVIIDVGINLWRASGHKIALSSDISTPTGVYSGDDGNILVLNSDGLAYYYCSDIEFTELECPWEYKDGKLSIQFYKFHCIAYADIKTGDFSEILLQADTQNWNAELFKRINVTPDEYIKRNVESYDNSVLVNSDGTSSFTLGGLNFTIPKQFRNPPNSTELGDNAIAFVDNDIDTDFMSTLTFYLGDTAIDESFPDSFLENAKTENRSTTKVAGINAIKYDVTGSLNVGFLALSGIQASGTLTIIPSPDNGRYVYVLMMQTPDRSIDNSELFNQILTNCRKE